MKRGSGEGPKVVAIVPAAGSGLRMKGKVPKQFLLLDGLPILAHTLKALERAPQIDEVILVVPEAQISFCRSEIVDKYNLKKISQVIPGGEQRQDSVYEGLKAISADTDWVMVHDGVRPFVTNEMIESAIEAARKAEDGAVVAIPMRDTPKEVSSDQITKTLDRQRLWLAQTPQVFRRALFLRAHEEARSQGVYGTDDAALVERLGGCVRIALGSEENIKVTTPADIELAEAIVATRRVTGRLPGERAGGSRQDSA